MYVRGDMELTVPDAGNFPLMATTLEALRGPLFGEGDLGDSDGCLLGGGDSYSIKNCSGAGAITRIRRLMHYKVLK